VRLEDLRTFMAEVADATNLRDAGARVGLGHEALRKFIIGETERPHTRTLKAMAELYLEHQKLAAAERESIPTAGQLKLVLPRGLEAGIQAVEEVFATRPSSGPAKALEQWLVRRLREEYSVEPGWGARKKRGR
jgi:hypothetical protein